MDRKVRWGVIGCGGIADRRTIPEGIMPCDVAELVAVQDVVLERAHAVSGKYDVQYTYGDENQLLANPDVDAVYIASPSNCHLVHVYAAANAGKHILCEKPLGISVQEARSAVGAAKNCGVKLGVNFMMRFHDAHWQLVDLVNDGKLGRIVMVKAELSCWYPPIPDAFRQDPALGGGGALIDMGSHGIDLLEQLCGPAVAVSSFTKTKLVQDYRSEDTAAVLLEFQNGALGVVTALFNVPDDAARNEILVYGTGGSMHGLTIGQASDGNLEYAYSDQAGYDASQSRPSAVETGTISAIEGSNMYEHHIAAFSKAILEDTDVPIPGEAGLHSAEVIHACYVSAREGRSVAL